MSKESISLESGAHSATGKPKNSFARKMGSDYRGIEWSRPVS